MILNSTLATLLLTSLATSPRNQSEPYPQMVNNSLVIDIVSRIHESYEFKNYIFYISERLVEDTDTATAFFDDFWDAFPSAPTVIIINNPSSMRGFLSTPSLCLILTTERDDPIMELAALSLKGVRFFKTIFILFPIVETDEFFNSNEEYYKFYENIKFLFEWIWMKQFLNTMLITIRNNIYTFDPYPGLAVVNKTEKWTAADFFPRQSPDFKGYVIQSPVQYDLPRVFRMVREPLGGRGEFISGVTGKIFLAFMKSINATFIESYTDGQENEAVDFTAIVRMVEEKNLEIAVNSYTAMMRSLAGSSYPIGINDWCIIVPFRNRSPEHLYLIKSFREYTWLLMGFSVLYITAGIWLCTPLPERDLSLSFVQSICSLLCIVPVRVLTQPYARIRYLFVILFLMGFFITNMYLTKMASYLTASTTEHQIDTVEDVIEAKLQIMMLDYEYEKLQEGNYPKAFLELIKVEKKATLDKHRDRLNTSFGYSCQSDRWLFLNKQQVYLKKPVFRLTSICMGPFYHVFPLQRDSHLASPLQYFIMAAGQCGLITYWNSEAFADALFLNYVHMMLEVEEPVALTVTFFRSMWYVWWFGMCASGLAFILEVKSKELLEWLHCLKREICEL